MKIVLKESAPAKINLFLEVLDKREDGYHNIDTVMQKIGLCDTLTLEIETDKDMSVTVSCDDHSVPENEDNICYKAAKLYLDSFGIKDISVKVAIEKRIPSAAGLGGGSSDAAATLNALNKYFKKIDTLSLASLSASIGADVPFFVCEYKAAHCLGIGEIITPCEPLEGGCILLAKCSEGISAGAGYKALDSVKYERRSSDAMLDALSNKSYKDVLNALYNSFEYAVLPIIKDAGDAKNIMLCKGADNALMSGSGPTVIGFFDNQENAIKVKKLLFDKGYTFALASL
jgi:4-diphosphocytidyl-2-C-methyl-D-erythritol kinase